MYHPGRPAQKPWRVARNYAEFHPDKMRSVKYRPHDRTARPSAREQATLRAVGGPIAWKLDDPHHAVILARVRHRGRSAWAVKVIHHQKGKDRVCKREQRRQQRRLNRWLADPQCPEWNTEDAPEQGQHTPRKHRFYRPRRMLREKARLQHRLSFMDWARSRE